MPIETIGTQAFSPIQERFVRQFSKLIVDAIPPEGLRELVEQLAQIYEFYATLEAAQPQLPPPLPSIRVKVSGSVTRPTFSVEEDD